MNAWIMHTTVCFMLAVLDNSHSVQAVWWSANSTASSGLPHTSVK